MFLSIIIPVHNTEKYIRNCLDSCLEQDIPLEDYEIICIDDCSKDSSLDILHLYESQYKNVRVISFSKNKGVSAARNAGLEQMHGDYCIFLDGDDFFTDNCFAKIKRILNNADDRSILRVGQYWFEENRFLDRHDNYDKGSYLGCSNERYVTNLFIPSNLASALRFQEDVAYGEDEIFSLELKTFKPKFLILDEPIYYYRKHKDSAMSLNEEKRIKRLNSLINSAVYIRKKYDLNEKQMSLFFAERIRLALDEIYKLPFGKEVKYLWHLKHQNLLVLKKNDKSGRGSMLLYAERKLEPFMNTLKEKKISVKQRVKKYIGMLK